MQVCLIFICEGITFKMLNIDTKLILGGFCELQPYSLKSSLLIGFQ